MKPPYARIGRRFITRWGFGHTHSNPDPFLERLAGVIQQTTDMQRGRQPTRHANERARAKALSAAAHTLTAEQTYNGSFPSRFPIGSEGSAPPCQCIPTRGNWRYGGMADGTIPKPDEDGRKPIHGAGGWGALFPTYNIPSIRMRQTVKSSLLPHIRMPGDDGLNLRLADYEARRSVTIVDHKHQTGPDGPDVLMNHPG